MTEKKFLRLFNKLQSNDPDIFETYEEQFGGIDTSALYSIVKDYEYENLGEVILGAVYESVNTESEVYDLINNRISSKGDEVEGVSGEPSIIKSYFDDIKKIYNKYDNNYNISFSEDDREKIISMNLKTVITIAKRYQGFGLSLEELIAAGNEGLIKAFDKFDPTRNSVKDNLLVAINPLKDKFTWTTLSKATNSALNYGDAYKKFVSAFGNKKSILKSAVIEWIDENIKPASFNSVASFWITADIKKALNNNTKGPEQKSESYNLLLADINEIKDEIKGTTDPVALEKLYDELSWLQDCADKVKPTIANNIRIDAPVVGQNNGGEMDLNNVITNNEIETDDEFEFEIVISKNRFYDILELLFGDCKQRDKRVFMKSFGIKYPGKLSVADIAQQEGLSVARVSQIVNTTLETVKNNIEKHNLSKDYLYSLLSK